MLKTIMNMQKTFQERLGYDFTNMTEAERIEFMRNNRGYLEDEVAEALYEMPGYKTWKDYSDMTEEAKHEAWQKVKMELVDALHFFTNLLLCAGFTPEELYETYVAKNRENHRRQDAGYTSDVSYREQGVDEVMTAEPTCTVIMDDNVEGSNDFVAVLSMADNRIAARFNTDTLTLGMAIKVLAQEYYKQLQALEDGMRSEVESVIGEVILKEAANA